ncbi:hypothetical protein [Pseudogemmobacter sonorensis]|uniref:hypothetical protein n=1 Tax=Pseudogemmobacter sonorensis TaxID=2989681 RepID=UPI003693903E
MKCKIAIIGCLILSGCVSGAPAEKDAELVRISVDASANTRFERIVAAAQPLADQACAAKQKQAKWVVASKASPTRTRLAFACW